MKRSFLVILIVISMLVLGACAPARPAGAQVSSDALIQALVVEMMAQQQTAQPTVDTPTTSVPQTGTTPAAEEQPISADTTTPEADNASTATVNTDGLNLRVGPGLNYRIRSVLQTGQQVEVLGRSNSGDWIEVHLADGRGGWVYRSYLNASHDLAGLPVKEAVGGPVGSQTEATAAPAAPSRYSLSMTIENNQALVRLSKFASDKDVTVSLSAGGKRMTVAGGKTGSDGAASFSFEMPRYWPDGSRLDESSLLLTVKAVDDSASRSASITYYSGW